jgi:hypothetical protein
MTEQVLSLSDSCQSGSQQIVPIDGLAWERADWDDFHSYDAYNLCYRSGAVQLRDETKKWLVEGLASAMPDLQILEYFRLKTNWFSEYDYLIVAVDAETRRLIGLLTSRWDDHNRKPFLHISVQMIAQRYQRTPLLKRMWSFHFRKVKDGRYGVPSVIALRTYHPIVYTSMRIFARVDGIKLYPDLRGAGQDLEMSRLAESVASRLSPGLEFSPSTGVMKHASVPPDFYPALPESRDKTVMSYFERNLGPADRLLCVLAITTEEAKRMLLRGFGIR